MRDWLLHTYIYWIHTDAMITDAWQTTDAWRKDPWRTSLEKYSPLTLLQGFERLACERMLETERKLHILTPLLWPSRCVLFSWCWGPLHLGFPRPPSVGCGFPYHISSLTLWESAGNCIGGFREPPRSGVAFLTTSGLYCLEFYWQLHRGFPRSPLVGCGLPYHISSLTLWESAGNCLGPKLNWVK